MGQSISASYIPIISDCAHQRRQTKNIMYRITGGYGIGYQNADEGESLYEDIY